MPVQVRYFTDPACPMSWGNEPNVRRLEVEFGDALEWRFVMGGLGRDYKGHEQATMTEWVEEAAAIAMPIDPLLWKESAITSTYPSCMAVKAAGDQGAAAQARYLRVVREGLMCFRRKLDALEPLVEEARRAHLDVERFRVDAGSMATVEAFGADLELTRDVPEGSPRSDRVPFPTMCFAGAGGEEWVFGSGPYERLAEAARAAGAVTGVGSWELGVGDAFEMFPRLAVAEVVALCGLPEPVAQAQLWRLVTEWKLKPLKSLTGCLFERA
ncbi:MAG: DsbA family protein [Thermoleophilaceae bacterium]